MPPRKNTFADEEHKLLIHSNMLNAERPAIGYHEVIIESPRHNAVTSKGKREDIKRLVLSWWNRGNALKDDPSIQHVLYFTTISMIWHTFTWSVFSEPPQLPSWKLAMIWP